VEKVKVTRKYQVTIPKEVRESIGVKVGDELLVSRNERRIVLEKQVDLEELAGAWVHV
jgi:antitoxin PrlF